MANNEIRIFIADDHHIFRNGISSLLHTEDTFNVVGEASDGQELLEKLPASGADVLLLDISMPRLSGLEVLPLLAKKYPDLKVLVFSMHDNDMYVRNVVKQGARGYLLKTTGKEDLMRAIKTVAAGDIYLSNEVFEKLIHNMNEAGSINNTYNEIPLSDREIEVLKLVAQGLTNPEIGERLFISPRTVDTHRRNIMQKLDIHSAVELANYVNKHDLH